MKQSLSSYFKIKGVILNFLEMVSEIGTISANPNPTVNLAKMIDFAMHLSEIVIIIYLTYIIFRYIQVKYFLRKNRSHQLLNNGEASNTSSSENSIQEDDLQDL